MNITHKKQIKSNQNSKRLVIVLVIWKKSMHASVTSDWRKNGNKNFRNIFFFFIKKIERSRLFDWAYKIRKEIYIFFFHKQIKIDFYITNRKLWIWKCNIEITCLRVFLLFFDPFFNATFCFLQKKMRLKVHICWLADSHNIFLVVFWFFFIFVVDFDYTYSLIYAG